MPNLQKNQPVTWNEGGKTHKATFIKYKGKKKQEAIVAFSGGKNVKVACRNLRDDLRDNSHSLRENLP